MIYKILSKNWKDNKYKELYWLCGKCNNRDEGKLYTNILQDINNEANKMKTIKV